MTAHAEIRVMTTADVAGCDELRRLAGWNQTVADWRRFLRLSPAGCFVAEQGGDLVGSVTTIAYGVVIGWIGMLLVHPDFRGRSIGKALLTCAIEHLQGAGIQCIKLDATPKGEPLYRSMGFREEWALSRFEAGGIEVGSEAPFGRGIRDATVSDWQRLIELDAEAFGTERGELMRELGASARRVYVAEENGVLRGYGMVRTGSAANYLGPVAARSKEAGVELLNVLLHEAAGRPVYIDVPERNEAAIDWLYTRFKPQRTLLRMFFGAANQRGDVTKYFGLADPAVG